LKLSKFDVVLFDIDNVLVDTRESYLAAIQKTVEIYLNRPGIVSPKDIDQFKLLGGFNDDWDCSYGIITFLETAIQGKPIRFGDHRRQRLSIGELGALFPERPLGMEGLRKRLQVQYERVAVPSFEKIARIFQEVYLGGKLFQGKPLFWRGTGLIQKEKLVFPKALLARLRKRGLRLGIVTGRNRFEAGYALRRFGIQKLFDCLVTIDDVRKAEERTGKLLRKPDPWPVWEAARRISRRARALRFLYVGDLPDDILAAKRAKTKIAIESAAFPKFARDPVNAVRELKKAKPDFILNQPRDLLKIT
jgi:HAD superfamily hydrolase (TIGR01548 family)